MTEFGKSPLLGYRKLENLGYNVVIYPVSTLRAAMGASDRLLREIRIGGSQKPLVNAMQTRAQLYELLQYPDYNQFDHSLFNFQVSHRAQPAAADNSSNKECP